MERQLRYAKNQVAVANCALRKVLIASDCDLEREQIANALSGLESADHAIDEFHHDYTMRTMPHRRHAGELEY